VEIVREGFLKHIQQAMQNHRENLRLQGGSSLSRSLYSYFLCLPFFSILTLSFSLLPLSVNACSALWNLSANEGNGERLVKDGLLVNIQEALRYHVSTSIVQEKVSFPSFLFFLFLLSYILPSFLLPSFLSVFLPSTSLQGIGALLNLTLLQPNRTLIVKSALLDDIKTAMQTFPEERFER
jgi:hypothetical protein